MEAPPGLRERKKLQTRREIESAALTLFAKRGFAHVTMSEIARAADVSLRTVAVHYPTKYDLVFAHHDRMLAQLTAHIEQRPEGETTFDALQRWIEQLVTAHDACTGPGDERDEQMRRVCDKVIQGDTELLVRARGSAARIQPTLVTGIARDLGVDETHVAPALAAAATTGIFTMLSERDQPADTPLDRERDLAWIKQLFDFLRGGLATLASDEPSGAGQTS